MKWFFLEQRPGDPTRDPIIGEFFSTDAIENPAEALVREGIQNALDAKLEQPIKVRLLLVTGDHAATTKRVSHWFQGAWGHFGAPRNGLQGVPTDQEPCNFLVLEDFGTTGLIGDERQPFDVAGNNNSFFYFFRAEGRSGKSEGDRGRWGVGKHVFPRSSRISTYFGLTVRADDGKHLLMGHTILKSHIMDGTNYSPDGYFGEPSSESMLMLPVSDPKVLDDFRKDFRISRDTQPGLSIVVPFVDSEITTDYLKQAVITDYFYPILKGELVVEIDTLDHVLKIDAKSLLEETASLESAAQAKLVPTIRLADWASFHSIGKEYVLRPCADEVPIWSDDLIPGSLIENMRNDLDNEKDLAIHVGLKVQRAGKSPVMSYFNVYLCHDGFESGRPLFIREGIIISDVRPPQSRARGVRSLVIIDDKPLATLLGDSENPAHTQWQKYSSNFKNKYANGQKYIEFVTRIVANIVNALGAKENQEDPYLFMDIFSLPAENAEDYPRKPIEVTKPRSGGKSGIDPIDIPPHERIYQLTKIRGGFRIGSGDSVLINTPIRLNIHVAYDLRKGNPLTKYNESDFVLEKAPIDYRGSLRGVSVLEVERNRIKIEIVEPDFQLIVIGFDARRDLYIKIDVIEAHNDQKI